MGKENFTELIREGRASKQKKITDTKKRIKLAVEKAKKEIAELTKKGVNIKGNRKSAKFKNEAAVIRFYKDPKNKNKFNKLSASLKYYIDSK